MVGVSVRPDEEKGRLPKPKSVTERESGTSRVDQEESVAVE